MNLFAAAWEWLSTRVRADDDGSAVSTEAALRSALGCQHNLHPIAYWDLAPLLKQAKEALGGQLQLAEWVAVTESNWPSIADRLKEASETVQLSVPPKPKLRSWVDPKLVSTGAIPFVPVAAVCHFGLLRSPEARLSSALVALDLSPSTDPWTMLGRVDPQIASTEAPAGVSDLTKEILKASAMDHQLVEAEICLEPRTPSQLLFHATEFDRPIGDLCAHLAASSAKDAGAAR